MRTKSTQRAKSRNARILQKAKKQDALDDLQNSELERQTAKLEAEQRNLLRYGSMCADAEKSARAEVARFRTVADSMPELISFVDAHQRYQFCNKSYEREFGLSPKELEGRPVRELLGEATYSTMSPYIQRALRGDATSFDGYIFHEKLGHRYEHIDFLPHREDHGKVEGFYVVICNLTELKRAEERFRTFVESAPHAIVIHDGQGKIVLVNSEAEYVFGYSRQELIGQPFETLIPPHLWRKYVVEWQSYTRKLDIRPKGARLELSGMSKDGSEFPAEISFRLIETTEGVLISSTITDISDRKRLEEQKRLASILEERARLARDLHDTLAQGFTGIILNLEAAEAASKNLPKEVRFRLNKAQEVARENLGMVRNSLMELSGPSSRPVPNLADALREFAHRADSTGRDRVRFTLRGELESLQGAVAENLLFIAQQATDNALRHAHPNVVHVTLSFDGHEIRLAVQDDGCGFVVTKVRYGMGLTNMRDRVEFIGGKFALSSRPGAGTTVEVSIPLLERPLLKIGPWVVL